jgi:polyisoprenoid-binding protein YceI
MLSRWRGLKRSIRIVVVAVLALVLLAGGAYGYFAYRTAGAPAPASIGERPTVTAPVGGVEQLDGDWVLIEGEGYVGYRVREKLGAIPAPSDAVGRTSNLDGRLTVETGVLTRARLVADVTTITSDEKPRDVAVQNEVLEVAEFPTATFELVEPVDLASPQRGEIFQIVAPAKLTVHGIRKRVDFPLQARWNGASFQVAGQLEVQRSDFDLEVPNQLGLRVSEEATIEVELAFARSARGRLDEGVLAGEEKPGGVGAEPPPATGTDRLVVQLSAEFGGSLYRVALDGSGLERVTQPSEESGQAFLDEDPSISPDGTRVVFARNHVNQFSEPPPPELAVVGIDGTGFKTLGKAGSDVAAPAWSPDGSKIAFVRWEEEGSSIWVANADGSDARRLVGGPRVPHESPAWSPDGKWIAYVSFTFKAAEDLWIIGADGRGRRRLTRGAAYDYAPSWSSTGLIAFGRDGDIYIVRRSGKGLRQLTESPAHDTSPAWSADGERVAFVRAEEVTPYTGRPSDVLVMQADGSDVRRVPLDEPALWPVWLP